MATIQCVRCGKTADAMTRPPMGGKAGQTVLEKVCPDCWNQWHTQSVAVINHYGLVLADPEHRAQLARIRSEFLNLPEE
jgi:Fe-S cluster biosynthesis and repair protein YggX